MAEQLYTIPVNEAFEADFECPICAMHRSLERNAIEYTMGPSYMEDDNFAPNGSSEWFAQRNEYIFICANSHNMSHP